MCIVYCVIIVICCYSIIVIVITLIVLMHLWHSHRIMTHSRRVDESRTCCHMNIVIPIMIRLSDSLHYSWCCIDTHRYTQALLACCCTWLVEGIQHVPRALCWQWWGEGGRANWPPSPLFKLFMFILLAEWGMRWCFIMWIEFGLTSKGFYSGVHLGVDNTVMYCERYPHVTLSLSLIKYRN